MRQRVTNVTESEQLTDVTSMTEINLPHPTAMKRPLRLGPQLISPQIYIIHDHHLTALTDLRLLINADQTPHDLNPNIKENSPPWRRDKKRAPLGTRFH